MKKLISEWIERRIIKDTRSKIKLELKGIDGKILDLGCGRKGSFDYHENQNIISSDRHKGILKHLRSKKKIVGDANKKLPFKDKEFDATIFAGVIQYLKNYENSLKEINRILKKGGVLILATVNRRSSLRRVGIIKKYPKKNAGEYNIFSLGEMKRLLEMNKFKVNKILGADFVKTPRDLSSNLIFVAIKE